VPILQQASIDDRKRLLELFPVSVLRHGWEHKGTKEELCYAAAADASDPDRERVAKFVDEYLGCCKQHVYVYSHNGEVTLPDSVLSGEKVLEGKSHALYVIRTTYNVVLRDPLEEQTLEFLWPLRVELTAEYMVVRFVVLEKNPSSYFERPVYVGGKSVDEKAVLAEISNGLLKPADLNKGLKKLWADGIIDSFKTKFKKTISTAAETMDEERGIKEHNPELYTILQESPLYLTVFQIQEEKSKIGTFSADPSNGIIGFTHYSEAKEDTDVVIDEILKNN